MRQLTVRLFGGMELRHEDLGRLTFPTRRARSIFAFLSMHRGRFYPRDVLCGLVWRETPESVARKGLRTALWRIRQVLDEIPADTEALVRSDGVQVGIPDEATLWVDVPEFEELTAVLAGPWNPRLDRPCRDRLESAAELYRGDLLDGLYDRWSCEERERLRLRFLEVLERLMTDHQLRGEWRQAIARGSELLRHDGLREHVHRGLMRCHYALGNRPAAVRHYQEYRQLLRRELDIEPMTETRALFESIHEERPLPGPEPRAPGVRGPEPTRRHRGSAGWRSLA